MGNLISSQDAQQLDQLGKVTLPFGAITNILLGLVIVIVGWGTLTQMRKDMKRQTALGTVTQIHCPAKNYCLVDIQLPQGQSVQGIPIEGIWNVKQGDTLWLSFLPNSNGEIDSSSAKIILEPSSIQKGKSDGYLKIIFLLPLILGAIFLAQGVIKLMGKNVSAARKLNSTGFYAT